jgi:hypothetical protein
MPEMAKSGEPRTGERLRADCIVRDHGAKSSLHHSQWVLMDISIGGR